MSRKKPVAHKRSPQHENVVQLEHAGLEQLKQEAFAAAKAAIEAQFAQMKPQSPPAPTQMPLPPPAPEPIGRAEPAAWEAPAQPEQPRGRRGPKPGPNSRYVEPGTRVSKRGRLDNKPAKSKVMSAFVDPEILAPFREKCKHYGVTFRFGLEQAMLEWTRKKGVTGREVEWKPRSAYQREEREQRER